MELTDEQWEVVRQHIPKQELKAPGRKGGRPYHDARPIVDAVLWVLRTGAPWADLPARFPPYQTCHRRYQEWVRQGVLERLLRRLAEDLHDRGKVNLTEAFIDGTHAGAKRGAADVDARTRRRAAGVRLPAESRDSRCRQRRQVVPPPAAR